MVIKNLGDYLDDLQKLYPTLTRKELEKVCRWSLTNLKKLLFSGMSVDIRSKKLTTHFGYRYSNMQTLQRFYSRQLIKKLRYFYNKREICWDGYYYFSLTDDQYNKIFATTPGKRGPKKKKFTFTNLKLYKLLDECKLASMWGTRFYRITYPIDNGFRIFYKKIILKDFELVDQKDHPLHWDDILVTKNYFKLIHG